MSEHDWAPAELKLMGHFLQLCPISNINNLLLDLRACNFQFGQVHVFYILLIRYMFSLESFNLI